MAGTRSSMTVTNILSIKQRGKDFFSCILHHLDEIFVLASKVCLLIQIYEYFLSEAFNARSVRNGTTYSQPHSSVSALPPITTLFSIYTSKLFFRYSCPVLPRHVHSSLESELPRRHPPRPKVFVNQQSLLKRSTFTRTLA